MPFDLTTLRKPLDTVRFPNGSVHQPRPFGVEEYAAWRELQGETDPQKAGTLGMQIIRACYPSVTEADILDCSGDMLVWLAAYPGDKLDQIQRALKNDDAAAAQPEAPPTERNDPAPDTAPSSPKMSGATSSRGSRRRRGKTGDESTIASPTDAPSSSGSATTTSTSASVSTPYAMNWTTSTAPSSPPTP